MLHKKKKRMNDEPAQRHSQPYICIYASQVAMCIGANKHKKISEALELTWQRVDPASFHEAMRRNGLKTEDELAADIIRTHSEVRDLVDLTLSGPCESSDEVAQQYDTVAKELRTVTMPDADRRLVDDVLKRNLYTSYGNFHEHHVLNYVRDTLGIQCREDPVFYKLQQGTCESAWGKFPWHVGGKIDAIDDNRTLLIEVKNRVNRLFFRVPFYEQVQVQTYLHLLDLEHAVLVECLKTRGPEADRDARHITPTSPPAATTVNVIPIHRDLRLWNQEIVPKLEGFVSFLVHIIHDTGLQDLYLQSKKRSALITAHVNEFLRFTAGG